MSVAEAIVRVVLLWCVFAVVVVSAWSLALQYLRATRERRVAREVARFFEREAAADTPACPSLSPHPPSKIIRPRSSSESDRL